MKITYSPTDNTVAPRARRWKRLGLAAFSFFLIKGLLWLTAPAVLYLLH